MMFPKIALLQMLCLCGCKGGTETVEKAAEDKCPWIDINSLAGDWIKVVGTKGDHKTRFRITGKPNSYEMILIPGNFERHRFIGKTEDPNVVFYEVLDPTKEEDFKKGIRVKNQVVVRPMKTKCSLRVRFDMTAVINGVETTKTAEVAEFLPFPKDTVFTFEPEDGPLFIWEAAKNKKLADKQMAERGSPVREGAHGESIPVGVFTEVEKDGDSSCTYDFDLFFDDQPYIGQNRGSSEGTGKKPPSVSGGYRHWYVDWYAPYSGLHRFEMWRFRKCRGSERERIGINALNAVLY